MKKFVALTALATAAAVAATPAAAQAPQGPRAEALVGYDVVRLDLSDFGVQDLEDEGVLFGVGAGYDFALSNGASLGVDVEASDSTTKETIGGIAVKTGRDLYAGGRVSFPLGADGSNVYLKGGYTNARFTLEDGAERLSDNADGYRLGGGAQFALRGKAYIGGEYRYSNYEGGLERHQLAATIGTRF